jgi:hypothetical protein
LGSQPSDAASIQALIGNKPTAPRGSVGQEQFAGALAGGRERWRSPRGSRGMRWSGGGWLHAAGARRRERQLQLAGGAGARAIRPRTRPGGRGGAAAGAAGARDAPGLDPGQVSSLAFLSVDQPLSAVLFRLGNNGVSVLWEEGG